MSISSLFNIARHSVQLAWQGRVALLFVISLSLLTTPLESSASGNVAPILNTSAPPLIKYYGYASNFDAPEAACIDIVAHQFELTSATNLVYDHIAPSAFERYPPENFYACFARWTINGAVSLYAVIPIMRSCDGIGWVNHAIMCTKHVCPANATGAPTIDPTICTCNENYEPDAAGTSCVPVTPCPIDNLTELTDPVAIGFENGNRWRPDGLTTEYQSRLTCVQNGITNRGGTYVGTSAYRPTEYQQHLFEIVQKNSQLNARYMTAHPECQELRDEITREMGPPPGHGLRSGQLVATPGSSRHESGTAFDVTPSGLTDAQLTSVYSGCGVTHTTVPGEPWHVQ